VFKFLEGEGGHLAVVLFIFLVGIGMAIGHVAGASDVMVGALSSLYTLLRTGAKGETNRNGDGTASNTGVR